MLQNWPIMLHVYCSAQKIYLHLLYLETGRICSQTTEIILVLFHCITLTYPLMKLLAAISC